VKVDPERLEPQCLKPRSSRDTNKTLETSQLQVQTQHRKLKNEQTDPHQKSVVRLYVITCLKFHITSNGGLIYSEIFVLEKYP
jgi:hypothetical protein